MNINLINSKGLKNFFNDKNYKLFKPYNIVNNNDTVFITAGIQPLLRDYKNGIIDDCSNIYISQPVIRTQYLNSISEGSSIAFTNITTAAFNNSEEKYLHMLKDWNELLFELGMNKTDLMSFSDELCTTWGNIELEGKRTFHYYKDIEIGDTTFFTKIKDKDNNFTLDSMSDLGFGLERLRWKTTNKSYYDLYSNNKDLNIEFKAYISALALLAVNNVKPSNKNSGYRFRLFSKKLVELLKGKNLTENEMQYLDECIVYWSNWQEMINSNSKSLITNEYTRNTNRYMLNILSKEGYDNLPKININISKDELIRRLISSGVDIEKIKMMER